MLPWSLRVLLLLVMLPAAVWGWFALRFQLPFNSLQNGFILLTWTLLSAYAVLSVGRGKWKSGLLLYLVLHGELLLWWGGLMPSHERTWADDVARLTTGEVQGSQVRLSNVRNFRWQSSDSYRVHWDERSYDLDRLASVDLITSHWGLDSIAHVLLSFGFDDGQFVTFSVEIRKESHEQFSTIGGLFKQYELAIVASDERDIIAVRPDIRGEDSYLYRLALPAKVRRALFLAYVDEANQLARTPRFYNTITVNCTSLVFRMMQEITGQLPLDARLLLTGYLPGYVEQQGGLMHGYSLTELRQRGHLNARSAAASGLPDYSLRIREGVPGWQDMPVP